MPDVIKSLPFEEMATKPPLTGRIRITDEMQQTLALLSGWDGASRRLLKVSQSGALYVCSPRVKGIINQQGDGDADDIQLPDIPTSEVLIRAKPTNAGRIWVNFSAAAADNVGYPLDSGEHVILSVNNLHSLYLHYTKNNDWAIVVYTK